MVDLPFILCPLYFAESTASGGQTAEPFRSLFECQSSGRGTGSRTRWLKFLPPCWLHLSNKLHLLSLDLRGRQLSILGGKWERFWSGRQENLSHKWHPFVMRQIISNSLGWRIFSRLETRKETQPEAEIDGWRLFLYFSCGGFFFFFLHWGKTTERSAGR